MNTTHAMDNTHINTVSNIDISINRKIQVPPQEKLRDIMTAQTHGISTSNGDTPIFTKNEGSRTMTILDDKGMHKGETSIHPPTDDVRVRLSTNNYIATQQYALMVTKQYPSLITTHMPLADTTHNSVDHKTSDVDHNITVDQTAITTMTKVPILPTVTRSHTTYSTTTMTTSSTTNTYSSNTASGMPITIMITNVLLQYNAATQYLSWIINGYHAYTYAYDTHLTLHNYERDTNRTTYSNLDFAVSF